MRRIGFTLTELLVTIAVISGLMALLMPAIQEAREAARRSSCQANLKQIAIALLHYESHQGALPTGAQCRRVGESPTVSHGLSWWVPLMPHLEQSALFERLDKIGANSGSAAVHISNGKAIHRQRIEVMLCPSTPLEVLWPVGEVQAMMPSYVGIAGASSDPGFPEQRVTTCCGANPTGEISSGGALISNRSIKTQEIVDGTSTTAAIGEASDHALDRRGLQYRIDGAFPAGWIMGTKAVGTPREYGALGLEPSWNITTIRFGINHRDYNAPGVSNIKGPNNPLLSAHTGGANMAMVDGSARFVSETMDLNGLKRIATRDDSEVVFSD